TLTDFAFGSGGGPSGAPTLTGGAWGELSGTVTLTDTAFLNEFTQGFTPGDLLSFHLSATGNFAGGIPDGFSLAILDNTELELPTMSSSGAFVQIDFGARAPLT